MCGTSVYRRPIEIEQNKGRVFCGQSCYGKACRKEKPCVICAKPILASAHKKTCSRGCANTHRTGIKYKVGSPKDNVKSQRALKIRLIEQRGKKCERCEYGTYEVLVVHHKDRNRKNSTLKNLELLCPNCHAEEHYLENSWLNDTIKV